MDQIKVEKLVQDDKLGAGLEVFKVGNWIRHPWNPPPPKVFYKEYTNSILDG
jgi:hypothetical protein